MIKLIKMFFGEPNFLAVIPIVVIGITFIAMPAYAKGYNLSKEQSDVHTIECTHFFDADRMIDIDVIEDGNVGLQHNLDSLGFG